jgi:exodeoxyribonuclease-3
MKLITWNVNGLRAVLKKGLMDFFAEEQADCYCLQETKMQEGQAVIDLPEYEQYFNYAVKKGYSGTAVFTKRPVKSVNIDIGPRIKCGDEVNICGDGLNAHADKLDSVADGLNTEGRLITVDYGDFYLVCEYTPNAQDGLARIDYRMSWEDARRNYLKELDKEKPVILCGDLNVAHEEIDLKNPKPNRGNAGFSDEERGKFTELLEAGFTDAFRKLYPDLASAYTWWSYRANARANNAGWRIDYWIVSNRIAD